MQYVVNSQENKYSESSKKSYQRYIKGFEEWRGTADYSDDLISNYVQCFCKGSSSVEENMGTCPVKRHKASSTRTMLSHLFKHLENHVHFTVSPRCRSLLCTYLGAGTKVQPVNQAKIFTMEDIREIFKTESPTIPKIRDKIYFALGICTLARSSEIRSLKVEDLTLKDDGIGVVLHRTKAAVCRAIQKIWVCAKFFGWDLLSNLKVYLGFIPPTGPLWRSVAPHPKAVYDSKPLAATTLDSIPTRMAEAIKLPDSKRYHSHSMRRTGATLLAIMGRTDEQIKTMGNWKSSSVASRYIETSEVSMKANGMAVAGASMFGCDVISHQDLTEKPKLVESGKTAVESIDSVEQIDPIEEDPSAEVVAGPPSTKRCRIGGGAIFTGSIQQVIIVSSVDAIPKTKDK